MKYCVLIIALLAGCSQLPVSVPSDGEKSVATEVPIVIAPAPVMAAVPAPVYGMDMEQSAPIAPVSAPLRQQTVSSVRKAAVVVKAPEHTIVPISKAVDEIAAQLTDATLTVDIPVTANVSDTVSAVVRIDQTKMVGQSTGSGTASVIKVSKIIEAKLVAPGFTVVPLSPNKQALSSTESTEWRWQLSGASPGKHSVHISINAIVSVDNDRAERTVKTFENTVEIEITPQQWLMGLVKQYWQWIGSVLLIPLVKWLWRKWKSKLTDQ